MMNLSMLDATVFGHVRGSLDFAIPKSMRGPSQSLQRLDRFYNWEQRQVGITVCRVADRGPIFEVAPHGFEGNSDMGLVRSLFISSRGCTTLNAASSRKRGQVLQTDDFDEKDSVSTEDELHSKPLGFGHGKVYETSLEEKLLEEIERDKTAQAAALLRKKNNVGSKDDPKKSNKRTTLEHLSTTTGVKVWVGDLPKKKNIERDLQSAFQHVSGLLKISPNVVGNEKTRDPICKGFGFLIFDNIDHAKSFVSTFQGGWVRFGKIEKPLSYRILTADSADVISSGRECSMKVPRLRVRDKTAVLKVAAPVSYVSTPDLKAELVSSVTLDTDILMDDMEESESTLSSQRSDLSDEDTTGFDVEVVQNTEEVDLSQEYDESSEEEEDDGDDFELGNEPYLEIEISCFVEGGNPMAGDGGMGLHHEHNALPMDEPREVEGQHVSEDDRRIEELEKRLRKKLEDARFGSQKSKPEQVVKPRGTVCEELVVKPRGTMSEEQVVKPRGFKSRKSQASKRTVLTGNSVGLVTRGLKKREREFMTGVLERYGRRPSNTKS